MFFGPLLNDTHFKTAYPKSAGNAKRNWKFFTAS